jgi:ABC-type lipoprotein export system ATPase subunit
MNIIGLLDKPDSGDIFFKGGSIANFSESESAAYRNLNIGFVFQDHLLLPYMNIHQNIFLPMLATKHSKIRLSDKKLYINELMIRAGIYDLKNKYPSQISGGEAQRVALVRALVNKPSILLADEPTGSLDAKNAESMGELLLEMNKEYSMTLILATHSIDIANKMSKKLHLVDGKLISE